MKPLLQARQAMMGTAVAVGLIASVWAAPPPKMAQPPNAAPTHLTEQQRSLHMLNRFAFGPRPGEVDRVAQMGVDRWFEQQLQPETIPDAAVDQRIAQLPTMNMAPQQIAAAFPTDGEVKKAEMQGQTMPNVMGKPRDVLVELSEAKLIRDSESERQLQEVMVEFWENHFNIFFAKGLDRVLMTSYIRDTIRPHALGKFRDLLEATAHSPGMMFYLDNWDSSKNPDPNMPPPRKGKKGPKGLNENYGREIMELHTLGVDGGYTQQDVINVARCFTGWSLQRPTKMGGDGGTFMYRPQLHDDGQKVILGHVIPPGGGERDGEAVLDILAHHPNTARHIATKLCTAFVSDTPSPALVQRVADTYMSTDGDIKAMLRTIERSPEFWESYRDKIKMPLHLVASAMRTVGANIENPKPTLQAIGGMGQPLYLCEPPTGYKDVAEQWVNSSGLVKRMNYCLALAEGHQPGITVNLDPILGRAHTNDLYDDIDILGHVVVNDNISDATVRSLRQAVQDGDKKGDYRQIVGLLLGSPDFQRR